MAQIVLTADRSLMSDYGDALFVGFAACAPKLMPEFLYKLFLCRPVPHHDGVADLAPYGTRKIEAALLEKGFDVAVAHPDHLHKIIDDDTKVVGITANDPRGLGPASSTFSSLVRKEPYSAIFYRKLLRNPAIRRNGIKIIAGGPGSWQLADERVMEEYGIDCVVVGEGEITAVEIFERALRGEELPKIVEGKTVPLEMIPSIRNPSIGGLVEISRGCGRGCKFCIPTLRNFRSRPIDRILEEVKINLAAGARSILLHAEDVLRYSARGPIPNEGRVVELLREVLKLTDTVSFSHFAFASVAAKPKLVEHLTEMMNSRANEVRWYSGQVGLETGSPELMKRHMYGKALPFKPEDWPEVVVRAHEVLHENNWVPCSTLISGLPGETAEDVRETIELVERLSDFRSLIVPLFFVPVGSLSREKFFTMEDMLPEHWMLMATCMKHDFKWVEGLAREYLLDPLQRFFVSKVVLDLFKRRLKGPLKLMEEGLNPYQVGNPED
jgi:radical SAM superfamily enzyme YgiQ (UPF0313 family)